jgi:hypothetical protein
MGQACVTRGLPSPKGRADVARGLLSREGAGLRHIGAALEKVLVCAMGAALV